MFIVNLLRLSIGGIPIWNLPSKNTLPVWLLRELYTKGVKDWGSLDKNLATTCLWYCFSGLMWLLTITMAFPLPCALFLMEFDVILPRFVVNAAFVTFSLAALPAFSYLILILPDQQLNLLSRLDRELRVLGGIFEDGLRSLNSEGMTQDVFEETLDTEMNKLSAIINQLNDEGKKYETRVIARRLGRLLRLSVELDFTNHHTMTYHVLKQKVEETLAI